VRPVPLLRLLLFLSLSSCPDTQIPTLQGARGLRVCSAQELIDFRGASSAQEREDLWVAFVDVGQGDATWIRTPGEAEVEAQEIIVDAGDCRVMDPRIGAEGEGVGACGISSGVQDLHSSPGVQALVNFLSESGWPPGSPLHKLVVTHPDKDHYGGAWSLLDLYSVENYLDPGKEADQVTYNALQGKISIEPGIQVLRPAWERGLVPGEPSQRQTGRWGRDLEAELLSADVSLEDNNASMILSIRYRGVHLLLMGDAEEKLDQRLIEAHGAKLQADVLRTGHHGGQNTSSQELLDRVFPSSRSSGQRIAIISTGRRDKFPDPEVLARIEDKVELVYRTDRGDEAKDRSNSPGDDHILMRISAEGELTVCYAYPDLN